LKDATAPKSETVYVGPKCDGKELSFCILFSLWRNGLVRLDDPDAQEEWKFLRRFFCARRFTVTERTPVDRIKPLARRWHGLVDTEAHGKPIHRPGTGRRGSRVRKKIKHSLLLPEKSTEKLLANYDEESNVQNDDEKLLPARILPSAGPYSIPDAAEK
jgi:hypothetical protein